MDIGTGKVTKSEMGGIAHYLLDVVSPHTIFDVVKWKRKADKAVRDISKKNKLPIVCGGTGLYIKALIENISYPDVKPDLALRARLEKKSTEKLFEMLAKKDTKRADTIDKHNRRQLIRALEIIANSGSAIPSEISHPQYNTLVVGISVPQDKLKKKITIRLHQRVKKGMIHEVKKLHEQGISWKRLSEIGLEYRYISLYLQDKMGKQEMLKILETKIGQYAKRQMTWFRKTPTIHWVRTSQEAEKLVKTFLKQEA